VPLSGRCPVLCAARRTRGVWPPGRRSGARRPVSAAEAAEVEEAQAGAYRRPRAPARGSHGAAGRVPPAKADRPDRAGWRHRDQPAPPRAYARVRRGRIEPTEDEQPASGAEPTAPDASPFPSGRPPAARRARRAPPRSAREARARSPESPCPASFSFDPFQPRAPKQSRVHRPTLTECARWDVSRCFYPVTPCYFAGPFAGFG